MNFNVYLKLHYFFFLHSNLNFSFIRITMQSVLFRFYFKPLFQSCLVLCLGVCVCVCVCVCVSVKFWSPPNKFQTSYPIDTKFRLHIVSYWNSPMAFIPFLNFQNCDREKFSKFIFSLHLINLEKFSNTYYASRNFPQQI